MNSEEFNKEFGEELREFTNIVNRALIEATKEIYEDFTTEDEERYIYKDNKKPFEDDVNNPTHYKLPGLDVEAIDIIKSLSTPEEFRGFLKAIF